MSLLYDVRRLAAAGALRYVPWPRQVFEPPPASVCVVCHQRTEHDEDCPVLALPQIVAVLESAERTEAIPLPSLLSAARRLLKVNGLSDCEIPDTQHCLFCEHDKGAKWCEAHQDERGFFMKYCYKDHASDCPWLRMPQIVAALEAADALVNPQKPDAFFGAGPDMVLVDALLYQALVDAMRERSPVDETPAV